MNPNTATTFTNFNLDKSFGILQEEFSTYVFKESDENC